MSSLTDLIATIRRNRELKVPVTVRDIQYTILCRRPTDVEALRLFGPENFAAVSRATQKGEIDLALYWPIAEQQAIGWSRADGSPFIENDFFGSGGGTSPVDFSPLAWREWCSEHREVWETIGVACMSSYTEHVEALRGAEKNS